MKLSFPLLTIFNTIVGASASDASISAFDIQVSCANVHHDEMSPKALAFGAKALEVSFNSVHKKVDGLTLTEVIATPNGVSNQKSTAEAKKGLRRGSTCKYCANDDLISAKETLFFAAKGMEEDLKTCKYCANDDDAAALLGENKIQLWQNELNAIFTMSPYSSLSKAEDCSITIAPRATEPAVKTCKYCANDDMQVEQQAVTIDVQCDKIDFSSVPVRVLSIATKALTDSFDAIHSTEQNHLSEIFLAGPRLSFSSDSDNKAIKTCKYCANDDDAWIVQESTTSGIEICKYRANDDLTTSDYAIEFSAITTCKYCANDDATVLEVSEIAANRAWEQLFMAKMMKEGLDTGACKLVMTESAMA